MLKRIFALCQRKERIRIIQFPQLLMRTSTLLDEGYTFVECIEMLLPYHIKDYSKWSTIIEQAFQDGAGPTRVFEYMGMKNSTYYQ